MRSLLVLPFLVFPAIVHAEPAKNAEAMHTDDCAKARAAHRDCVITMGSEKVEAGTAGPGGIGIVVLDTMKHNSLIHIRQEFIVEIIKSAEDL